MPTAGGNLPFFRFVNIFYTRSQEFSHYTEQRLKMFAHMLVQVPVFKQKEYPKACAAADA